MWPLPPPPPRGGPLRTPRGCIGVCAVVAKGFEEGTAKLRACGRFGALPSPSRHPQTPPRVKEPHRPLPTCVPPHSRPVKTGRNAPGVSPFCEKFVVFEPD